MSFRDRLLGTLRVVAPALEHPGVLVVGSEVPNLLEDGARSTLVVSEDVDIGIPVSQLQAVKKRLEGIRSLSPSPEEPSVWLPEDRDLIEVNFLGLDPDAAVGDAYVFEDPALPLMVFGALSLLRPGPVIEVEGLRIPLPRTAGLLLEKLVTDRTGEKGDRDLLVALGLLLTASTDDLADAVVEYRRLPDDVRHAIRSNLTVLSLLSPRSSMPDPIAGRSRVAALLSRFDGAEVEPR